MIAEFSACLLCWLAALTNLQTVYLAEGDKWNFPCQCIKGCVNVLEMVFHIYISASVVFAL